VLEPLSPRAAADAAMERYAAGDDRAFADLYDALAPMLHRYLLRRTHDAAAADDLLQQTLLHMHRARGRFIRGAPVTPWAFAIARRLFIDGVRRTKRDVVGLAESGSPPSVPSPGPPADELVQADEIATRIQRELARLPATQRVAFELIKQEGLTVAEAAAVLGTTVGAVKVRAHRAYEALRLVLGDAVDGVDA
jgi:RNA polymerase sigma-70 factor, ECF subfamily